ncbi:hypothetical protein JCM11251_005589 [Rhodosporidiobolus azoricus]
MLRPSQTPLVPSDPPFPASPTITASLLTLPSALLTLLRRHHFTSTRLPGPHIFPTYLQIACWALYFVQAWMGAWLVAEKAWPRDENGQVVMRREARRVGLLFCGLTAGALVATSVTAHRFVRSLSSSASSSPRALRNSLRILRDNLALNRSPSASSVSAVWPSVQRAGEGLLNAEKGQGPARTGFLLTLSILYIFLTLLSLLSLLSTLRQLSRLSQLLTNRKRRNQLFSHSRRGSRSSPNLDEGREVIGQGGTGGRDGRDGVGGRQCELRWTAAVALLSFSSTLSLGTSFLHLARSRRTSALSLIELDFAAWVVAGGTAITLVALASRNRGGS